MGGLFMARRLWCPALRVPICDFRNLLNALLVWITVFLGEPKLIRVLTQPDNQSLLDRPAATNFGIRRYCRPSLYGGSQLGRVVRVVLRQIIGASFGLRKEKSCLEPP